MRVAQHQWGVGAGWTGEDRSGINPQLVLVFGSRDALERSELFADLKARYPNASLIGCSTSGQIHCTSVSDDAVAITAIEFQNTALRTTEVDLQSAGSSFAAGAQLAEALGSDLAHVLVLSDGLNVNGSELVKGLYSRLPSGVTVTGGLSGDGAQFQQTVVLTNRGVGSGKVAAVGFVGDRLRVGIGSMGGWDTFGPERIVTRSAGNVLFELDGRSALSLYKEYLGEHAAGLPATALLFPLSIWGGDSGEAVVRTILAVNENDQSMTFAGDIPQGCHARLMRATTERLIDGAGGAASSCQHQAINSPCEFALLISCVGRKLLLKQRVEEEVEAVVEALGNAPATGFYSYGEIAPFSSGARCELHNQTMTITTFREV